MAAEEVGSAAAPPEEDEFIPLLTSGVAMIHPPDGGQCHVLRDDWLGGAEVGQADGGRRNLIWELKAEGRLGRALA